MEQKPLRRFARPPLRGGAEGGGVKEEDKE